jgi:hypothetical protein
LRIVIVSSWSSKSAIVATSIDSRPLNERGDSGAVCRWGCTPSGPYCSRRRRSRQTPCATSRTVGTSH